MRKDKRISPVFLYLIVVSVVAVIAIFAMLLMTSGKGSLSSDEYFATGHAVKSAASQTSRETVKCVFKGSKEFQTCTSGAWSCTGAGSCTMTISGPKGTPLEWSGSCAGIYTTKIDGRSEAITFDCAKKCTPGTKCRSANTVGYQDANCIWNTQSVAVCEFGCKDGVCNPPPVSAVAQCTAGYKCYANVTKGYQNADCSWNNASFEVCKFGCENGACKQNQGTYCMNHGWRCLSANTMGWLNNDCNLMQSSITECALGCGYDGLFERCMLSPSINFNYTNFTITRSDIYNEPTLKGPACDLIWYDYRGFQVPPLHHVALVENADECWQLGNMWKKEGCQYQNVRYPELWYLASNGDWYPMIMTNYSCCCLAGECLKCSTTGYRLPVPRTPDPDCLPSGCSCEVRPRDYYGYLPGLNQMTTVYNPYDCIDFGTSSKNTLCTNISINRVWLAYKGELISMGNYADLCSGGPSTISMSTPVGSVFCGADGNLHNLYITTLEDSSKVLQDKIFQNCTHGCFNHTCLAAGQVITDCHSGFTTNPYCGIDNNVHRVFQNYTIDCKSNPTDMIYSLCPYGCQNSMCFVPGSCMVGWNCQSKDYLAYKNANCSWDNSTRKFCPGGCSLGACKGIISNATNTTVPEINTTVSNCTPGWSCLSPYSRAYVYANCSWNDNTFDICATGCSQGYCAATSGGGNNSNASVPGSAINLTTQVICMFHAADDKTNPIPATRHMRVVNSIDDCKQLGTAWLATSCNYNKVLTGYLQYYNTSHQTGWAQLKFPEISPSISTGCCCPQVHSPEWITCNDCSEVGRVSYPTNIPDPGCGPDGCLCLMYAVKNLQLVPEEYREGRAYNIYDCINMAGAWKNATCLSGQGISGTNIFYNGTGTLGNYGTNLNMHFKYAVGSCTVY